MKIAIALAVFYLLGLIYIVCYEVNKPKAETIQHDGHNWVRDTSYGHLTHHPDCPCHNVEK